MSGKKVTWWKEKECGYEFASVFPLFLLCFLSIVAYVGKRGTGKKCPTHPGPFFPLVFKKFFLLPLLFYCFLYLLFLPFHRSSEIFGKLSLNVETTCLVSGKSFNAPASAILRLHGGKDLHLCMWNALSFRPCTPVKGNCEGKLFVLLMCRHKYSEVKPQEIKCT